MRRLMGPGLMVAVLAGCVAEAPAPALPPEEDACGAQALQGLVGKPLDALALLQAPTRVLRPDQPVTMDYSATRLNIAVDDGDRILRIFCG
jgi:hypothetical protein